MSKFIGITSLLLFGNIAQILQNKQQKRKAQNQALDIIENVADYKKLISRQNSITMKHGNMYGEVPEQVMASLYIKADDKVLEIGGNIGRNSMLISSILNDTSNYVILESDNNSGKKCLENIKINKFKSQLELSALSKRKLIQKGWNTKPSDVLEDGYKWVNTISINELRDKYRIKFNVLVLDCEGAFYYILQDMPEILDGIELILMENDYRNVDHYNFVKQKLEEHDFINIRSIDGKPYGAEWSVCCSYFFQAWKKQH